MLFVLTFDCDWTADVKMTEDNYDTVQHHTPV